MPERDDIIGTITERYERRLSDECATLRVEAVTLRADMNREIGGLRADMNREIGDLRADMNREIGGLRTDMNREIGGLRADMNREIGDLRAGMNKGFGDLRAEMIERNAELLKWGLGFWVAQAGVMAALLTLIR